MIVPVFRRLEIAVDIGLVDPPGIGKRTVQIIAINELNFVFFNGCAIGIAIGAGTNVALESAGIILVRDDPRDIPKIVKLSRLTYTKMIQNLVWALGYNVVAIPAAAGAFAYWGFFLRPEIGALLMSLSTVIVVVNAMTLKRVNLEIV